MVVRFHVVAPAAKQRTFTVRLPILLGRGDEAKFRIQHDLVSRRHCELFERDGQVYVRDLGSTNGTFLNDEQVPVSAKTRVPPGGVVRIGGLSFAVDYQAPAAGDGTKVEDDGRDDADASLDESRVEANAEALDEQPDFKVEHADEEPVAAPADVIAPHAADEAAVSGEDGAPGAEPVEPAVADADAFRLPEAAGEPAEAEAAAEAAEAAEVAAPKPAEGFDFLSGAAVATPPAETPQWPVATDAVPDDAPDDDQLNAFFKGLK